MKYRIKKITYNSGKEEFYAKKRGVKPIEDIIYLHRIDPISLIFAYFIYFVFFLPCQIFFWEDLGPPQKTIQDAANICIEDKRKIEDKKKIKWEKKIKKKETIKIEI